MAVTEYIILHASNEDSTWKLIGQVQARSAQSAIRERIDGVAQSSAHYGDGTYVAVPVRSWQPVSVKTETKTQLRFT